MGDKSQDKPQDKGLNAAERAPAKRGDLRAYLGSVEGLYPLEGEVRNTGVFEGFAAKIA